MNKIPIALHRLGQSDRMDKSTLRQLFVSLLFVICTGSWAGISVDASRVTLNQNGYNDLVVAISSEAPVEKAQTIISNIKVGLIRYSALIWQLIATYLKNLVKLFWIDDNIGSLPSALQGDR